MLDELNNLLIENNYNIETDNSGGFNGTYLPDFQIDIVFDAEENILAIRPPEDEPVVANDVETAYSYIVDLSQSEEIEQALQENHYEYQQESPRFFSIGNERLKIIDGRFYLNDENGEQTVYIDVPSVIGALQEKFLGER
ncbi:hypothetical protein [Streptomyces sp. ID05-04B]|nr:hypothetical protein [Streptomyces sp. ID05-04B]